MSKQEKLDEFIDSLSPQVWNVVDQVLAVERGKLHMKKAKGILNEIRQIIQQESDQHET